MPRVTKLHFLSGHLPIRCEEISLLSLLNFLIEASQSLKREQGIERKKRTGQFYRDEIDL